MLPALPLARPRTCPSSRDVSPTPAWTRSRRWCRPRLLSAAPAHRADLGKPAQVLNIVQAEQIGCDIITVTHDLLAKLPGLGRDLSDLSLATVQMFRRCAGVRL